jgi:hypothetical protein
MVRPSRDVPGLYVIGGNLSSTLQRNHSICTDKLHHTKDDFYPDLLAVGKALSRCSPPATAGMPGDTGCSRAMISAAYWARQLI